MVKCYLCDKEATRSLDAIHWSDATGGSPLPEGKDSVRVCEEHNQECWEQIDKQEFKTNLSILLIYISIIVLLIIFIVNLIF